jgi:DOMON domain
MHIARISLALVPLLMATAPAKRSVERNGMRVSWHHADGRLHITMSAPTQGWVGIGFNTSADITGTHLILGRVRQGKAEVVEHYTRAPGDYPTISALGGATDVRDTVGEEADGRTTLRFSLPIEPLSLFQRALAAGTTYELLIAFSAADDFQHHSRMRTSASITL